MGTVGNTNPWAPYNTYKDCSQGICSIYCPQYCYLIFPPPPSRDGGTHFSPLIIAVISVLASALLLVIYYALVTRFCRGRRRNMGFVIEEDHENSTPREPCHVVSMGLDEKAIKAIAVQRYRKGGMMVEGSECVVCLSEFQENETLRILPKCNHPFHLMCIDPWLGSHSVCPLCRANVVVPTSQPPQVDSQSTNAIIEANNQQTRHGEQMDPSSTHNSNASQENSVNNGNGASRNDQGGIKKLTRSNSLGALPCSHQVLSLNTSKMEQWAAKKDRYPESINGSSNELGVKRCFSTGRLMFTDCSKGKKSILPY